MYILYITRWKNSFFLGVDRKNLLCVSQLTQQRNRYRRGTWSGPYQFAVLQLHSLLRFSLCELSETTSEYTPFLIHHVQCTSFFLLLNRFLWFLVDSTKSLSTSSTLLLRLFSNVFETRCWSCYFCRLLVCSDRWLSCIAIIMTSSFVFWTWNYIGKLKELFFLETCHWNCTLR